MVLWRVHNASLLANAIKARPAYEMKREATLATIASATNGQYTRAFCSGFVHTPMNRVMKESVFAGKTWADTRVALASVVISIKADGTIPDERLRRTLVAEYKRVEHLLTHFACKTLAECDLALRKLKPCESQPGRACRNCGWLSRRMQEKKYSTCKQGKAEWSSLTGHTCPICRFSFP